MAVVGVALSAATLYSCSRSAPVCSGYPDTNGCAPAPAATESPSARYTGFPKISGVLDSATAGIAPASANTVPAATTGQMSLTSATIVPIMVRHTPRVLESWAPLLGPGSRVGTGRLNCGHE